MFFTLLTNNMLTDFVKIVNFLLRSRPYNIIADWQCYKSCILRGRALCSLDTRKRFHITAAMLLFPNNFLSFRKCVIFLWTERGVKEAIYIWTCKSSLIADGERWELALVCGTIYLQDEYDGELAPRLIRELKQTTTTTATKTPPNKRFNEQNNGCARAL